MRWYGLVALCVLGVGLLVAPGLGGGWIWDLGNALGFAALALMLALFIDTGRGGRLRIHRLLGWSALVLVGLHAVVLLIAAPDLVEYLKPSGPLYMGAGVLALLALLALLVSARADRRVGWFGSFRLFRRIHWLLGAAVLSATAIHLVGSGFYLRGTADATAAVALMVAVACWPLVRPSNPKLADADERRIAWLLGALAAAFVGIRAL